MGSASDSILVIISKAVLCWLTSENSEKIHSIIGGVNIIIIIGRSARAT